MTTIATTRALYDSSDKYNGVGRRSAAPPSSFRFFYKSINAFGLEPRVLAVFLNSYTSIKKFLMHYYFSFRVWKLYIHTANVRPLARVDCITPTLDHSSTTCAHFLNFCTVETARPVQLLVVLIQQTYFWRDLCTYHFVLLRPALSHL